MSCDTAGWFRGKKIKAERADRAGLTVYALDNKTGALTVTHDGKPSQSTC